MSERPLSVLMFCNATTRGGAEEHILQLLHGLDRVRFQPHLACTAELAEKIASDLPRDVKVTRLTLDHLWDVQGVWKLARAIKEWRIDILHSHMFRASLFASPVGWLCRVPVIIETSHGREVWRTGMLKSRFFVDRIASLLVDRFIAVSEATAHHLTKTKKVSARKVSVIRSAVDLEKFSPSHREPSGLRESLGFAPFDPILLVAGRLEPQKGHRVLIDAMPAVVREFPNARLVCLSDGSLRKQLEQQVVGKNLENSVKFLGYQPDVRDWMALADVCVLPSFYEGLPLAAIEALAVEKPMVATAVDGTPEVVINERTGLSVPAGDSERLAEAICRLLRNLGWAKEMARAGRELVLSEFSIEKLVRETQQLYESEWAAQRGLAQTVSRSSCRVDAPMTATEKD